MTPILVFAYNRPLHLQRTLDSLFTNELASQSKLYIFCDGKKAGATDAQRATIDDVHRIAYKEKRAKEVLVFCQPENLGLSKNIRYGTSQVFKDHDAAIVLEDDLILSSGFLHYMNEAVKKYASSPTIHQVSGFQFPFDTKPCDPFFMPLTVTIGWATWKRVWDSVDFAAPGYELLKTDAPTRHRFNLNGAYDYTDILLRQLEKGAKDSWGVLFWWHVFKHQGQVLYPGYSLVQHRDDCGSGTHISNYEHYDWPSWNPNYRVSQLPDQVQSSQDKFDAISRYIRRVRWRRFNLRVLFRKLHRKLFPA